MTYLDFLDRAKGNCRFRNVHEREFKKGKIYICDPVENELPPYLCEHRHGVLLGTKYVNKGCRLKPKA